MANTRLPPCPTCGLAPIVGTRFRAGHLPMALIYCPRGHREAVAGTAGAAAAQWAAAAESYDREGRHKLGVDDH